MVNGTKKYELKLVDFMPDSLTQRDYEVYNASLGNWTYCSYFLSSEATKKDIGIMIKMELEGKRRIFMLHRLIGRLCSICRDDMKQEAKNMIESKSNG